MTERYAPAELEFLFALARGFTPTNTYLRPIDGVALSQYQWANKHSWRTAKELGLKQIDFVEAELLRSRPDLVEAWQAALLSAELGR